MDCTGIVELGEVNERYERRKAQNRKAQRKFRDKKSNNATRVKDNSSAQTGSSSSSMLESTDNGDYRPRRKNRHAVAVPGQIPAATTTCASPITMDSDLVPHLAPNPFACGATTAFLDDVMPFLSSAEAEIFNFDSEMSDLSPPLFTSQDPLIPSNNSDDDNNYNNTNSTNNTFSPFQQHTPISLEQWPAASSTLPSPLPQQNGGSSRLLQENTSNKSNSYFDVLTSRPGKNSTRTIATMRSTSSSDSLSIYESYSDPPPLNSPPPPLSRYSSSCAGTHQRQRHGYDPRSTSPGVSGKTPAVPQPSNWNLPLHIAAERGHESIVKALIESAVDVNERDSSGCTALHTAVQYKHEGVLKVLLENGADVNAQDRLGWTPVHTAAENGFTAGLRLLLEYGGNLMLKARKKYYGRCPWD